MAYSTYYDFLKDIDPRDNPAVSTDELYLRITDNSYFDLAGAMLETPPNPGPPAPVPAGNPDWIEPGIISDTVMAQPKDGAGNDIETPNSFGFNEFGQFFVTGANSRASGVPGIGVSPESHMLVSK